MVGQEKHLVLCGRSEVTGRVKDRALKVFVVNEQRQNLAG